MNKSIFTFCIGFLLAAPLCLFGQNAEDKPEFEPSPLYTDNKKHKEFMLNMTPFIAQFVPFNANTLAKQNAFDIQFRRLRNGKGWRYGLGVNIAVDGDDVPSLFFRFGRTKRSQVSKKLHLTRSFDAFLAAEDVSPSNRKLGFSGIGPSFSVGLEYDFTSRFSVSTEGSLYINVFGDENLAIRFIPPIGLFFHMRL